MRDTDYCQTGTTQAPFPVAGGGRISSESLPAKAVLFTELYPPPTEVEEEVEGAQSLTGSDDLLPNKVKGASG